VAAYSTLAGSLVIIYLFCVFYLIDSNIINSYSVTLFTNSLNFIQLSPMQAAACKTPCYA